MIGEVSALRQQQAAVEAELAEKQGELEAATAEAGKPKSATWTRSGPACNRALGVLRERLVAIYESGSPDVVNVVLESASWSEMAARAEYLNQIQSYDDSVVDRVKGAARRGHRPRSSGWPPTAPRSRKPATRSPSRSAKSPPPAPRPRPASPN